MRHEMWTAQYEKQKNEMKKLGTKMEEWKKE